MLTEASVVKSLEVMENGDIKITIVNTIYKDGSAYTSMYQPTMISHGDPDASTKADELLGVGTVWRNIAQLAFDNLPTV